MSEFDVVVIGGGAAGLSAALVLSRARRAVLVIDAGEPRNAPAAHLQGYLSRDGLPPTELLAIGRREVEGYGGQVCEGQVSTAYATETGFEVALAEGTHVRSRRLLVATGLRDDLPAIRGLRDRFGRDVLHCPYCHGWEVRDRRIGVIGGSPTSLHQVQLVRQWGDDVTFFTNGTALTDDDREQLSARSIVVVDGEVTGLVVTDDALRGIEVGGSLVVHRDVAFVAPGFVPNSCLLVGLGCAVDDAGWVTVDGAGRTSVAGVWAAGNAANPRAQVITAAGEGSAAAIALNADLVMEDIGAAVVRHRTTHSIQAEGERR